MLNRVEQFIQEKSLVQGGDRVLCLVSGGADSTAMFSILSQLARGENQSGAGAFALGICHVNYGRRGEASVEDEIFVRQLGERAHVPVHVIQAPNEQRSNFQAWARDFRYLAAQNLCRWQGYSRIAVAHNKDDRIETFLYRLMTYSGRRSLVVMPPRKGRIIRPLLLATAAEIRNYCVETGLAYREDESNRSLDYTRNQIRQLVIPRMAEIRPDFRERITDTLSLLEDEDAVLRSVTDDYWRRAGAEADDGEGGEITLRADAIAEMPRAVARLVVRRWLNGANVRPRLSRRLLDSVVFLCRQQNGTRSVSLSDGLQVERRYDRLILTDAGQKTSAASDTIGVSDQAHVGQEHAAATEREPLPASLALPGRVSFGSFEIEAVRTPGWDLETSDPMRATIDAGRLEGELLVRSWRPGDRFAPLGLNGSKSVQDLFTDAKVPRSERGGTPIITCGGKIVWVCGYRIAEEFKVTDFTRERIGLKVTRRAVERAV
ncbi:MAG: tRNA lysidine(34) synthetase TilS [Thermoleophilia bacterium]